MAHVTAVVPHWNRRALLESLLAGLKAQTHPVAEVIVVDNGSADGSAGAAEALGARVIRLEQNLGFAAAVNRGLSACRTELAAIVNNDVEPEPDWLERLASALAANPDAWFAGGKILDFRRRDIVEGAWDLVSRGACAWRAGHGRPDGETWNRPRPIRFPPLAATLTRRALFDRVGLLEEGFESFLEDVEFGLRCARAGLAGLYVPAARVYHWGGATLGRWHPEAVRRIARNQLLLVARHYPERWWLSYGWAVLVGQALWGLVALRHGAGWAYLRGKAEGIRRFSEFRRPDAGAGDVIEASERELFALQRETGFDTYWRLYFALT
jgi:GT2 family glycosyltransferase